MKQTIVLTGPKKAVQQALAELQASIEYDRLPVIWKPSRWLEKHQAADPHCTCNDCIQALEAEQATAGDASGWPGCDPALADEVDPYGRL